MDDNVGVESSAYEGSGEASEDRRGRACCLNMFALLVLAVAALLVVAHSRINSFMLERVLTEAGVTQADLDAWLDEKVEIPAQHLSTDIDAVIGKAAVTRKISGDTKNALNNRVESVALHRYNTPPNRTTTGPIIMYSVFQKLLRSVDLNSTQTLESAEWNKDIEPEISALRQLVDTPGYRFHIFVDNSDTGSPWEVQRKLQAYAALNWIYGNTSEALSLTRLHLRFVRDDYNPDGTLSSLFYTIKSLAGVMDKTTDVLVLRQALKILNEAADVKLPLPGNRFFDNVYLDEVYAARMMVRDGYLDKMPNTHRGIVGVRVKWNSYAKRGDPSRIESSFSRLLNTSPDELRRMYSDEWFTRFWNSPFSRNLFPEVYSRAYAAKYYNEWDYYSRGNERQVLGSHFFRMDIARKIARLEGRTTPLQAPEDYVPQYMPKVPDDPYSSTGAKLKFAADKGYYSVGRDGKDGTPDDLTNEDYRTNFNIDEPLEFMSRTVIP